MSNFKKYNVGVALGIALAGSIFIFGQSVAFAQTDPNTSVASSVQSYFADISVMIAIAKCESGPRQFKYDGTPLIGGNGTMVGIFQIDPATHAALATSLGFDINTVAGNMGYARYLYGIEGTEPWISSFGCWNNSNATTTIVTSSTPALTMDLSLGAIDPQVLILQQMLNADGFTLATSGPGSAGNETTKFGALTYAALKKFQCTQGIACSGEESTTGYGFLNAATRLALNNSSTAASASTSTVSGASSGDSPAEIAELQSRISALVTIVAQLEALIAARRS